MNVYKQDKKTDLREALKDWQFRQIALIGHTENSVWLTQSGLQLFKGNCLASRI